jgi:hypothetical protein
MFHKATTTRGILDESGEQIEVFSIGDTVRYEENGKTHEVKVILIEWNDEDPNDFVLFYADADGVQYVHRMDVEHV